jgi:hypothetical protein
MVPEAADDFAQRDAEALRLFAVGVEFLHILGRELGRREHRPHHGQEEHQAADVERVAHGVGHHAANGHVADAEDVREHRRQQRGDDRAAADEKGLHREAGGLLARIELVADESAERLHRDVDRGVHHPQHRDGHPQRRRIGHQEQRDGSEDGADEEERAAAAPVRVPGVVAQVADDRLHQQARDGCGEPEQRQVVRLRAEGREDAAGVGVLQREAKLDAEEAEAHVPQLPERQARLQRR